MRRIREICDETPTVYKNIESVPRAQKNLVKFIRRLQPLLSHKGR